jgi:hypothetical protein
VVLHSARQLTVSRLSEDKLRSCTTPITLYPDSRLTSDAKIASWSLRLRRLGSRDLIPAGIGATPIYIRFYIRYPDGIIGLSRDALEHLPREADDRQHSRTGRSPRGPPGACYLGMSTP